MFFYMQMKNWFIIFIVVTMTYLVYQKTQTLNKNYPGGSLRASAISFTLFK